MLEMPFTPCFRHPGAKYNMSGSLNTRISQKKGRAYSLPDQCPRNFISYDEALECCQAKGPGWHLMTNYEWAGIALWSRARGLVPRGNNSNGSDCGHPEDACAPGDLYFRNHGEPAALRGGHWYHEKSAGMFWLNLAHTPSYTARRIGFRCAWIPDEDIAI